TRAVTARSREAGDEFGPAFRQPDVGAEGVVEPAPDVVAGRPAPMDDLVVTAAAAQVAGPAAPARLLSVHHAVVEPPPLSRAIDAHAHVAHRAGRVVDESVAGEEITRRRDAEVARAGAAWVRAVRPPMDLPERFDEVREWIALTGERPPLTLAPALDHVIEQRVEVGPGELVAAGRRAEHRREPHAVKAERHELVQGLAHAEIP